MTLRIGSLGIFLSGCVVAPAVLSGLFGVAGVADRQRHRGEVAEQVRALEEKNRRLEDRIERLQAELHRLYRAREEGRTYGEGD